MKVVMRILMLLIAVVVGMLSMYFALDKRYAKETEINKAYNRIVSLEAELKQIKAVLSQEYAKQSALYKNNQKLLSLQQSIEGLKNDFSQWVNRNEAELQKFNSLGEEVQRLKETYLAKDELVPTLERSKFLSTDYYPVDIDLGELPSSRNEAIVRDIPDSVPGTAKEILIYAYVATSYVRGGIHQFKLSVNTDDAKEAAFFIYASADVQSAWSYNSENEWLPMPKDRKIRLQTNGEASLFGDWKSKVKIIAYR